jgi:hypothetical protein
MKTIRYLFIIAVIISGVLSANTTSAQPNTLSYMKGIPQTKDINPALYGINKGFYISMPGLSKIDLSVNTSGFTYNDIIHKGTGQYADSLVVDFEKFHDRLAKKNFLREMLAYSPLEFGFKVKSHFFGLSISEKLYSDQVFGKGFVSLIKDGNAAFIGQDFNTGKIGINGAVYHQLALNYGKELNDKLTIGGAAKILFGLAAVRTKTMNLEIYTPADASRLDIKAEGEVYLSAPVELTYDDDGMLESVSSEIEGADAILNFGNPGFAVDLGAAYQLNEKLQLSASIIDLGFISWKEQTHKLTQSGEFLYRGVDISNSLDNNAVDYENPGDLFEELVDSITEAFDFLGTPDEPFNTTIPTKIYLGGDYQLTNALNFGGLARLRFGNGRMSYAFTSSANVKVGNVIDFSLSHSIINGKANMIGAGIGLRGGPLQIYLVSDNLLAAVHPTTTSYVNARFGINFIFGNSKKDEICKTCPGMDPVQLPPMPE